MSWIDGESPSGEVFGELHSWDGFSWAADWFDEAARMVPLQPAIEIPIRGESATYEELSQLSHDAARWLNSRGIASGSAVILEASESLNLWVLILALDRIGAVTIQRQPGLPQGEAELRMPRGLPVNIIDDINLHQPNGSVEKLPPWDANRRRFAEARLAASAPMWGYYTSGTTGAPKLVIHNRVSYSVGHLSSVAFHALPPGARHSNLSGPGWAKFAWSAYYVPFASLASYVALSGSSLEEIPARLRRHKVETVCAAPAKWRALLSLPTVDNLHLRQAFSAGEPISTEIAQGVASSTSAAPRSVFGMTEMTAALGEREPGCGLDLLPGYSARAAKTRNGSLALELNAGISMMSGYAERGISVSGEQTSREWFRTGDAVSLAGETGRVTVHGRLDDLINIEGHLRSPLELEREVESAIRGVRAMVIQDAVNGDIVALLEGGNPDIVGELPSYISRVEHRDCLPRTITGKLRRRRASQERIA